MKSVFVIMNVGVFLMLNPPLSEIAYMEFLILWQEVWSDFVVLAHLSGSMARGEEYKNTSRILQPWGE